MSEEQGISSSALPGAGESVSPSIGWDSGTAYDLFMSLAVLHNPEKHGLRASWAAGVRSRLSSGERKTLETADALEIFPLHWIYSLPEPKDAASAIWALRQVPAADRLSVLTFRGTETSAVADILQDVAKRRSWDEQDQEALRSAFRQKDHEIPRAKTMAKILDAWSAPDVFGENYLAALQSYHNAFFAEEENQIASVLQESLENARRLADRVSLEDLVDELSQGVHLKELSDTQEVVLVPSYWISPLILFKKISTKKTLLLFGGRPPDVSLVAGEMVPDQMLRMLKAMADPTRLRILRYLAQGELTPSQLARRLRLRAPTVTHHLNTLRLAGLVRLTLEAKGERHYAARLEALNSMDASLREFLESDQDK